MELQLKNIGMIKEANVKIDGLTVIAGENDTGKSTVGKALFYETLNSLLGKTSDVLIDISENISFPILIETPEFLSEFKFFNEIIKLEEKLLEDDSDGNIETLRLSSTKMSLLLNLALPNQIDEPYVYQNIKQIIKGKVYYDNSQEDIFFIKEEFENPFLMDKTSSGIKMFGFFQILLLNGSIKEGTVLILDEPEVHLHPKWQLEMAKVIVELVKNGVKVLVNSHSPYMIEALERYAEKADVPADFYLAEDGYIAKVEDNNSKTLAKIFHKLSAPYETFNQMDSEILKGG